MPGSTKANPKMPWHAPSFFNRLGEVRDRSFEQQRYRASGLNLVIAAIEALLTHLSHLGWEHVNLTGDYTWRHSKRTEKGQFRPLRRGETP